MGGCTRGHLALYYRHCQTVEKTGNRKSRTAREGAERLGGASHFGAFSPISPASPASFVVTTTWHLIIIGGSFVLVVQSKVLVRLV